MNEFLGIHYLRSKGKQVIGQEKMVLMVGPGLYLNYYKFPLTVCGGSGSLAKFQGKKPLDALA